MSATSTGFADESGKEEVQAKADGVKMFAVDPIYKQ